MSSDLVEQTLEQFLTTLDGRVPHATGAIKVLVAFSGGPDSTALLAALAHIGPRLGVDIHAAHLDHGHDADSKRRARAVEGLANRLGTPVTIERLEPEKIQGKDGLEATARHARYAFLERVADEVGASHIATAHHADDQAETVVLRLGFGTGLEGLAGIRPVLGRRIRPLLGLRRRELLRSLERRGIEGLKDPTNDDIRIPRNRVRHLLMPKLERDAPRIVDRLTALASAAANAAGHIDRVLADHLDPRPVPHEPGVQVDRRTFENLPDTLLPHALALLHRRAGAPYPAGNEARGELIRQLTTNRSGRAGCDCPGGWRWEVASGVLQLVRRESSANDFTYTVEVPGEVDIPELGLRLRLRQGPIARWMFRTWPLRAGLADRGESLKVQVRSRRPGDRILPLGRRRKRRLKDLLIDQHVPRRQRDRLPLLIIDGEIAWIPGVTISESFRLIESGSAWVAEIEPTSPNNTESSPSGESGGSKICSPL